MELSLALEDLAQYVTYQLVNFFPDGDLVSRQDFLRYTEYTLERTAHCFGAIHRKYFFDGQQAIFSHLHSDQYAMYLYLLSNTIYQHQGSSPLADKVYYLNKTLHGIDVYCQVELPQIFLFNHCVGTVLGLATYADYFSVGQNCTVGNNRGVYPRFETEVAMYAGSCVVGATVVGTNTHISGQTFVRNQDIPANSVVFGKSPDLVIKPSQHSVLNTSFNLWPKNT